MNHQLDQEVVAGFISEAKGYLPEIMLGLESFAADVTQLASLKEAFRYAHIIKGAASMLGFMQISEVAYQLEVTLEMLCEEHLPLSQELLEDLCQNVGELAELLDRSLADVPTEDPLSIAPPTDESLSSPLSLDSSTLPPLLSLDDATDVFTSVLPAFSWTPAEFEEKGETILLEGDVLPEASSNWSVPATAELNALENEEPLVALLNDTNFTVSLPETTETPTVGELDMQDVAQALKASLGADPLPPQPEFELPSALMAMLPDLQVETPFDDSLLPTEDVAVESPAATLSVEPVAENNNDLLEGLEENVPTLSFDNIADELAEEVLTASVVEPVPIASTEHLMTGDSFLAIAADDTDLTVVDALPELLPEANLQADSLEDVSEVAADETAVETETLTDVTAELPSEIEPAALPDLPSELAFDESGLLPLPNLPEISAVDDFSSEPAWFTHNETEDVAAPGWSTPDELEGVPEPVWGVSAEVEDVPAPVWDVTAEVEDVPPPAWEVSAEVEDVATPVWEMPEEVEDVALPVWEVPEEDVAAAESVDIATAVNDWPELPATPEMERVVATPPVLPSVPADMAEELMETFLLEAEEHLQNLHTSLRVLNKNPNNRELLQAVRRSSHSLKGTAAMVGLDNIMQLAHRMEDVLDLVYDGDMMLTGDLTLLLMQATDALEDMSNGQSNAVEVQHLYKEFARVLSGVGTAPAPDAEPVGAVDAPTIETDDSAEITDSLEPVSDLVLESEPDLLPATEDIQPPSLPVFDFAPDILATETIEPPALLPEAPHWLPEATLETVPERSSVFDEALEDLPTELLGSDDLTLEALDEPAALDEPVDLAPVLTIDEEPVVTVEAEPVLAPPPVLHRTFL